MNCRAGHLSVESGSRCSKTAAFTLPDLLVSMAILLLVVAGVMASHLFGLGIVQVVQSKVGATEQARRAIDQLVTDIRNAKFVRVGQGSAGGFADAGMNTVQQGNAVQLCTTTNTNAFVRYFVDTNDWKFKRTTEAAVTTILFNSITNADAFTLEDVLGTVVTNQQNNSVVGLNLQFSRLDTPDVPIGSSYYYKSYSLVTKMSFRGGE